MSQQDFVVIIILAVMWLLSQQLPLRSYERSYEPTGSPGKDKAVDDGKC
jgi:hypothetical protein